MAGKGAVDGVDEPMGEMDSGSEVAKVNAGSAGHHPADHVAPSAA